MKYIIMSILMTVVAFGTACGQAPEPVANDGIQVHGNWTVTVTNPDGTVDAVHEFENQLGNSAPDILTALLVADTAVQQTMWSLSLSQPTSNNGGIAYALACQESITTGTYYTKIPAVATRNTLVTGSPVTLAGVCTVQTPETTVMVHEVTSEIRVEPGITISGSSSSGFSGADLTSHVLEEDITLANNQSLSFNVVISFS